METDNQVSLVDEPQTVEQVAIMALSDKINKLEAETAVFSSNYERLSKGLSSKRWSNLLSIFNHSLSMIVVIVVIGGAVIGFSYSISNTKLTVFDFAIERFTTVFNASFTVSSGQPAVPIIKNIIQPAAPTIENIVQSAPPEIRNVVIPADVKIIPSQKDVFFSVVYDHEKRGDTKMKRYEYLDLINPNKNAAAILLYKSAETSKKFIIPPYAEDFNGRYSLRIDLYKDLEIREFSKTYGGPNFNRTWKCLNCELSKI